MEEAFGNRPGYLDAEWMKSSDGIPGTSSPGLILPSSAWRRDVENEERNVG